MKKDIAKKWIKALRSGKYERGAGWLKDSQGRYCCLGVLCELAAADGVGEFNSYGVFETSTGSSGILLTKSVQEWAGIGSDNGEFKAEMPDGSLKRTSLATLNDGSNKSGGKGLTFKQIADVIEAYAEEL